MKDFDIALDKEADKNKAKILSKFFKTGKGEYGQGDIFLGIAMPIEREIAKEFSELEIEEIQELLNSKIHEKRMIALLILINKFKKANEKEKEEIFNFYLSNTRNINNWDLVDLSCRDIVGGFLLDKDRNILYNLAKAENLWERRIAIISTFFFIQRNEFKDTLEISEILVNDREDLIHKAVGWMLRELGKRNSEVLESFLKKHKDMPRTMLRYAIEKFPENKRKKYLELRSVSRDE